MDDNTKSFLDKIQELKSRKIKVTALSKAQDIDCSPLSFKQQKDLISTVTEGAVGILRFQKYINDIILENTGDDSLLITDKLPIILKLRIDSIGSKIKLDDQEFDIAESLERAEKTKFDKLKTVKDDVIVELHVPSLKNENQVINTAIDLIKKENDKDTGRIIANIYTYEITKFIKTVKIGESELNFADISVRDRIKIVENLPLSLNKKIVSHIENIKKIESDILSVEFEGDKKRFELDVTFFDN